MKTSPASPRLLTRRRALQSAALVTAALAVPGTSWLATAQPAGSFTLPDLPYPVDALEPHLDARTMEIHHRRHHAAYVNGLNTALAAHPELPARPLEEWLRALPTLPESIRTAVRNHGGGHANHALFWTLMKRDGGGVPSGELARALDTAFGSYSGFQTAFTRAALGVFGSGWAWLTLGEDRTLRIETTPNQDSPLTTGRTPLLGLDVWEHAYYLNYQNRRADYITAFFKVVNWEAVTQLHQAAAR